MREIPLTRGLSAIVDDEDYDEMSRFPWHAVKTPGGSTFYAARRCVRMHNQIMNVSSTGIEVDHENGNGLDNRRSNLRLATRTEQLWNTRRRSDNTSGYKGVSSFRERWRAEITVNGRRVHLGLFDDPADAGHAYDAAALEYFGEFACTNAMIRGAA